MPETNPQESASFLSGEGVPVALREVESELARLWGPTAEREGGPDLENPAITRVSLANLVVVCLGAHAPHVRDALDAVVTRNPCRVLVLRTDERAERGVAAAISAHCTLPLPGIPQVCSERILLSANASATELLPSAARPLFEPDLPLVLWWVGDTRAHRKAFLDLASEATRLIADLPDPGSSADALRAALDPEQTGCRFSRDLAWFGIARWRELVAAFFDPPGSDSILNELHTIEIRVRARDTQEVPRVAAWLAAWLAGQLGWTPKSARRVEGRLEARFAGPSGTVDIVVETHANANCGLPRIDKVALHARPTELGEDERFVLERIDDSDYVRAETCFHTRCSLGRVVHVEEADAARRVSAALESNRIDPPYQKALPILLWLIESSGSA